METMKQFGVDMLKNVMVRIKICKR